MPRLSLLALPMLAFAAAPLAAQTANPPSTVPGSPAGNTTPLAQDRGFDKPSPRVDAVNAVEAPVTAELNATSSLGSQVIREQPAKDQAQYDADRAAYMVALMQHDRSVQRADARYARQQGAYADAMAAWRIQVAECQAGKRRACDLPTPMPSQFY